MKSKKAYFKRKLSPRPVVLVRWLDAYTVDETRNINEIVDNSALPTITVGFLIMEDDEGVTVVTDLQLPIPGSDEQDTLFRGKHFIPRGMICDVTVIRK